MKIDRFLSERDNLKAENRLLKFAIVIIGVAVFIQGFFTCMALKYQKVVLVPAVVDRRIEISGKEASPEYVKLFSRYSLNLLMNYTPATADSQFQELLTITSPGFYPKLKAALDEMLESIRTLHITSVYHLQRLTLDPEKRLIEAIGVNTQWSAETKIKSGRVKHRIRYRIADGRFQIHGIEQEDVD